MADLARHEKPELSELVIQVSKLADSELDDALKYIKAHLNAITAFRKICDHLPEFRVRQAGRQRLWTGRRRAASVDQQS